MLINEPAIKEHKMAWTNGPFLGFDTETTGVSTASDRIVTAALILRQGDQNIEKTWLLNPGVDIPVEASNIHGITTEYAREHGQDPKVGLEEIAVELVKHLETQSPVVAFNATFDISILDAELVRHGLTPVSARLANGWSPVIDPLVIDRAVDRWRKGKRKLVDLCAHYGVDETGTLHTADADVAATLDVLDLIIAKYPELAQMTLADLHSYQERAHHQWATSFNQYLTKIGRPADVGTTWLSAEG
ncbi:exonuclease domain-containing protein [Jonesiaceae bacterium BS-20]|uniref:Exonuclease domain-containing protein n=1 Tax=Jonesiaceae bacterium BS-20 TaxID=3120821 RepID=A0AAU7DSC8_9MICO